MYILFRYALMALACAVILMPQPSTAATITLGGSQEMGCRIAIDGQIGKGDADALRAVFEEIGYPTEYTPIGRRICLNSPGGSLLEGLAMADLIAEWNFGTAVPDGASCESACSIVFLAGRFNNPEAGGAFSVDRVMHPRAQVGFHAPSLLLGERSYSRHEVDKAYAIALDSMAGILRHRAESLTSIPDSLFLELLGTPPFEMTYVETVGQAARWQIGVVPVALPAGGAGSALSHACWHVDSGLLDYAPSEYGAAPVLEFSYEELTDDTLRAFSSREFRYEGSAQCEIGIFASGGFNDYSTVDYVGVAQYTGGATDQDVSGTVYAYMLYPSEQRIDTLPVPRRGEDLRSSGFFQAARGASGGGATGGLTSCRLTQANAQVINVNEFVNLRSAPGLRAPIVGQLRLAERVQVPDVGRLLPVRGAPRGPTCVSICDGLSRSPSDVGLKDSAEGCIAENMLWYQVISASGVTGYVSRHFLTD